MLAKPIKIRDLTLINRLELVPMATRSGENGFVTQKTLDYYKDKTQTKKIGLVITEHHYVSPEGMADPNQLSAASDDTIPSLKALADVLHESGAAAIVQISHAGSASSSTFCGLQPISCSPVLKPKKQGAELPKEMTKEDMARVKEAFVAAALRVEKAGFDGVEIHAAHGYLLNQFLSPVTNKRTDEYGGSLENRCRYLCEVIQAVRKAVGEHFILAVRLGGCDYYEGGNGVEEAARAAAILAPLGVDLLDVSGGVGGYVNPDDSTEGYMRLQTRAIKQATDVPVVLAGGFVTAEAAEAHLQQGDADLIGVGRAILKDSLWPAAIR